MILAFCAILHWFGVGKGISFLDGDSGWYDTPNQCKMAQKANIIFGFQKLVTTIPRIVRFAARARRVLRTAIYPRQSFFLGAVFFYTITAAPPSHRAQGGSAPTAPRARSARGERQNFSSSASVIETVSYLIYKKLYNKYINTSYR